MNLPCGDFTSLEAQLATSLISVVRLCIVCARQQARAHKHMAPCGVFLSRSQTGGPGSIVCAES